MKYRDMLWVSVGAAAVGLMGCGTAPPSVPGNAAMTSVPGNAAMTSVPGNAAMTSVPGNAAMTSVPGNAAMTSVPGNAAMTATGSSSAPSPTSAAAAAHPAATHAAEMPAALPLDEERLLYLVPGGKYTAADIAANGGTSAGLKFRGRMAAHDMKPKPGDRICPVTLTKANPKFAWVIDGKTYEFCCPPCIDEFVKLAKETPAELKGPETFVK